MEVSDDHEYWKKTLSELQHFDNLVLIHVCDENRQITKDFCCKRNILVEHMKYFEGFLAENDSGYEDIDISVHCDVEIFEWLMTYIHRPNHPPPLEKALVVSILISSDFLQMESLVDLCLTQIAQNLGDIIKLPIDLSCISEKLLNKLAALTPSKALAVTKDRKDKILTKLYKRRVELDFSRKSGGPRGLRSIATSLTCCKNCATMYLDSHSSSLVCRSAKAAVAFRGKLVRRHVAVQDWSLTHYLKLLHSTGNLNWEQIYWHVWAACIVMRVKDVVFSVSEVHRYTVDVDGLLVHTKTMPLPDASALSLLPNQASNLDSSIPLSVQRTSMDRTTATATGDFVFSLNLEDDLDAYNGMDLKMPVSEYLSTDDAACDAAAVLAAALHPSSGTWGSGLNPLRRPDVLCKDIFEMISSQIKLISAEGYKSMIETLARTSINAKSQQQQPGKSGPKDSVPRSLLSAGSSMGSAQQSEIKHELWGFPADRGSDGSSRLLTEERFNRGRSHSPANRRTQRSQYRQSQSHTPLGKRGPSPDSSSPSPSVSTAESGSNTPGNSSGIAGDRRSRSSSSGPSRRGTHRGSTAGKLLPPKSLSRGGSSGAATLSATTKASVAVSSPIAPSSPRGSEDVEDEVEDQFETLKCFPAEIQGQLGAMKGPVHGVWLTEHPLSTFPYAYYEMQSYIESFSSNAMSETKRREWQTDLLREYDDKRMDRMEDYLLSHRRNMEEQMQFASATTSGARGGGKDTGDKKKMDGGKGGK